jgi:aryl-alcohol dehydrogenase-like predicted oxidoreductase
VYNSNQNSHGKCGLKSRLDVGLNIAWVNVPRRRYIEKDVIPWCREHGVGILAHSVLGKGLCSGKHGVDHIFPDDDERSKGGYAQDFSGPRWVEFCAATDKLKVIAARRGYSCAELAVGWVLRNPEVSVALVGAKNTEQVMLNARFMQNFTAAELAEIEAILDAAPDVGFQGEE